MINTGPAIFDKGMGNIITAEEKPRNSENLIFSLHYLFVIEIHLVSFIRFLNCKCSYYSL